ncbi:MAG TPA: LUD domain-containing protein [Phnomibacter sp.]|nr:LUD domain-containing protein [Phnomibacter sp.]
MSSTAKSNILKKIKQALDTPVPVPFPAHYAPDLPNVFRENSEDLAVLFAEQFTKLQGQFVFCMNMHECVAQLQVLMQKKGWTKWYCTDGAIMEAMHKAGWQNDWHPSLADCHVSITACESLVARTGTMVLSSAASSGRTTSVYAPIHICIAHSGQLVYDPADALSQLQMKYGLQLPSQISFASGPSRTADIEKTLVTGVHGPKEVFCFLIESA